jgi:hypothetical protein
VKGEETDTERHGDLWLAFVRVGGSAPVTPKPRAGELFAEPIEPGQWRRVFLGWFHWTEAGWEYYPDRANPEQRRWHGPLQLREQAQTALLYFYLRGMHPPGIRGRGQVVPAGGPKGGHDADG